jgi:hypothetical protein
MPDPVTAIGGGSFALGLFSSIKQGKAADRATDVAQQTTDWQKDLANQQWQRYMTTFAPLEEKMVKEAQVPVEQQPGFARMMGTIDRGYSDVASNTRRTLAGRYPSGSGLEVLNQDNIEMNRTRTKAGAFGAANEARFSRMLQAAGLGRGIPTNVMNTAGNVGAQQGNIAGMQANAAQNAWGSMGNTAGNLMQMYLMSKGGGTPYAGAGTYGVTPSADTRWNTWH